MAARDKTFDLQKADTEVVFLALGSIGDCLPLCALASSLGSLGVDSDRSQRQDEQGVHDDEGALQQSQVDADGVDSAHHCADNNGDDRDFKRLRKRRNASGAVGVVTHRCHCDLLEGGHLAPSWCILVSAWRRHLVQRRCSHNTGCFEGFTSKGYRFGVLFRGNTVTRPRR